MQQFWIFCIGDHLKRVLPAPWDMSLDGYGRWSMCSINLCPELRGSIKTNYRLEPPAQRPHECVAQ
jgi:hypothetical protein